MQSHRHRAWMAVLAAIHLALSGCGGGPGDGPTTGGAPPQGDLGPEGPETRPDLPEAPSGEPTPAEPIAHRVLHLTNLKRRAAGLPPLKGGPHLDVAAQGHAEDMAARDYFDHRSPDGRSPWDRMEEAGYAYDAAGENIAAGQASAEAVVAAWMNSPGHRANLLNPSFRELGVGYTAEEGDTFPGPHGYHHYWVQDFGARGAVFPLVIEDESHRVTTPSVSVYLYGEGWAEQMQVSEAPGFFADATWVPFAPEFSWELSGGTGAKQVCARLRHGTTATTSCDSIWLE